MRQASGLYVDNKFQGAVADRAELDGVLDGILDQYRTDADNERAEFVQKVEVVDGLYPTSLWWMHGRCRISSPVRRWWKSCTQQFLTIR